MAKKKPLKKPLKFKDYLNTDPRPGEDPQISATVQKRRHSSLEGKVHKAGLHEIRLTTPRVRPGGGAEGKSIDQSIKIHIKLMKQHMDKGMNKDKASKKAMSDVMNMKPAERKKFLAKEEICLVCKDCGCEYGNLTAGCTCSHNGSDPNGKHWVKTDPNNSQRVESLEVDEATKGLNPMQRMKRRMIMRRNRVKIERGRKLSRRKMADMKKLKRRANRAARNAMIRKITKGQNRQNISAAMKKTIETRLGTPAMANKLNKIARRLFPKIRKAEMKRKKSTPTGGGFKSQISKSGTGRGVS